MLLIYVHKNKDITLYFLLLKLILGLSMQVCLYGNHMGNCFMKISIDRNQMNIVKLHPYISIKNEVNNCINVHKNKLEQGIELRT